MAKQSFYAVKNGKKPGIYNNWAECESQVKGFRGAQYRKFGTYEEAQEYLGLNNSKKTKKSDAPIKLKEPYAFVDGSYNQDTQVFGYGGFLAVNGKKIPIQGSFHNQDSSARNVSGELYGAMEVVKLAESMNLSHLDIYYDYAGIEPFAKGDWKPKTPLTKKYASFMQSSSRTCNVNFVKVAAHTGIEGNELADILAKDACGVELTTKSQREALADIKSQEPLQELLMKSGLVSDVDDSIVVFDIETADKHHIRICQIGIVKLQGESPYNVISSECLMIDPECEFGYYNTKIHGITADDVKGAPNFKEAWEDKLSKYFTENTRVVGHNLKFDTSVMDKCCAAYGIEFPHLRVCDTQTMAKHLNPAAEKFSLDTVAAWFDYELTDEAHHDALNDAMATAVAFRGFKEQTNVNIQFTPKPPKYSVKKEPVRERVNSIDYKQETLFENEKYF